VYQLLNFVTVQIYSQTSDEGHKRIYADSYYSFIL